MSKKKKGRIEFQLCVFGETLSGQWVVELHKMGARISLYRSERNRRDLAMAFANKLSYFCHWLIVVDEVLH